MSRKNSALQVLVLALPFAIGGVRPPSALADEQEQLRIEADIKAQLDSDQPQLKDFASRLQGDSLPSYQEAQQLHEDRYSLQRAYEKIDGTWTTDEDKDAWYAVNDRYVDWDSDSVNILSKWDNAEAAKFDHFSQVLGELRQGMGAFVDKCKIDTRQATEQTDRFHNIQRNLEEQMPVFTPDHRSALQSQLQQTANAVSGIEKLVNNGMAKDLEKDEKLCGALKKGNLEAVGAKEEEKKQEQKQFANRTEAETKTKQQIEAKIAACKTNKDSADCADLDRLFSEYVKNYRQEHDGDEGLAATPVGEMAIEYEKFKTTSDIELDNEINVPDAVLKTRRSDALGAMLQRLDDIDQRYYGADDRSQLGATMRMTSGDAKRVFDRELAKVGGLDAFIAQKRKEGASPAAIEALKKFYSSFGKPDPGHLQAEQNLAQYAYKAMDLVPEYKARKERDLAEAAYQSELAKAAKGDPALGEGLSKLNRQRSYSEIYQLLSSAQRLSEEDKDALACHTVEPLPEGCPPGPPPAVKLRPDSLRQEAESLRHPGSPEETKERAEKLDSDADPNFINGAWAREILDRLDRDRRRDPKAWTPDAWRKAWDRSTRRMVGFAKMLESMAEVFEDPSSHPKPEPPTLESVGLDQKAWDQLLLAKDGTQPVLERLASIGKDMARKAQFLKENSGEASCPDGCKDPSDPDALLKALGSVASGQEFQVFDREACAKEPKTCADQLEVLAKLKQAADRDNLADVRGSELREREKKLIWDAHQRGDKYLVTLARTFLARNGAEDEISAEERRDPQLASDLSAFDVDVANDRRVARDMLANHPGYLGGLCLGSVATGVEGASACGGVKQTVEGQARTGIQWTYANGDQHFESADPKTHLVWTVDKAVRPRETVLSQFVRAGVAMATGMDTAGGKPLFTENVTTVTQVQRANGRDQLRTTTVSNADGKPLWRQHYESAQMSESGRDATTTTWDLGLSPKKQVLTEEYAKEGDPKPSSTKLEVFNRPKKGSDPYAFDSRWHLDYAPDASGKYELVGQHDMIPVKVPDPDNPGKLKWEWHEISRERERALPKDANFENAFLWDTHDLKSDTHTVMIDKATLWAIEQHSGTISMSQPAREIVETIMEKGMGGHSSAEALAARLELAIQNSGRLNDVSVQFTEQTSGADKGRLAMVVDRTDTDGVIRREIDKVEKLAYTHVEDGRASQKELRVNGPDGKPYAYAVMQYLAPNCRYVPGDAWGEPQQKMCVGGVDTFLASAYLDGDTRLDVAGNGQTKDDAGTLRSAVGGHKYGDEEYGILQKKDGSEHWNGVSQCGGGLAADSGECAAVQIRLKRTETSSDWGIPGATVDGVGIMAHGVADVVVGGASMAGSGLLYAASYMADSASPMQAVMAANAGGSDEPTVGGGLRASASALWKTGTSSVADNAVSKMINHHLLGEEAMNEYRQDVGLDLATDEKGRLIKDSDGAYVADYHVGHIQERLTKAGHAEWGAIGGGLYDTVVAYVQFQPTELAIGAVAKMGETGAMLAGATGKVMMVQGIGDATVAMVDAATADYGNINEKLQHGTDEEKAQAREALAKLRGAIGSTTNLLPIAEMLGKVHASGRTGEAGALEGMPAERRTILDKTLEPFYQDMARKLDAVPIVAEAIHPPSPDAAAPPPRFEPGEVRTAPLLPVADVASRDVVARSRELGSPTPPPSQFTTKGEVLKRFGGADPLELSKRPDAVDLSGGGGTGGSTKLVTINGEKWAVKSWPSETGTFRVQNEILMREVIRRNFPEFETPEALSYIDNGKAVVATRFIEGVSRDDVKFMNLPLETRVKLAAVSQAFGLQDMNHGNILFGANGRMALIDFEMVGTEKPVANILEMNGQKVNMAEIGVRQGWAPFVDRQGFNDPAAYRAEGERWKAAARDPAFRQGLENAAQVAGMSRSEARTYAETVLTNIKNFDRNIALFIDPINAKYPTPRAPLSREPAGGAAFAARPPPPSPPLVPAGENAFVLKGRGQATGPLQGRVELDVGGKKLEVLTAEQFKARFPDRAARLDPTVERLIVDPANPGAVKGLRAGDEFVLGRDKPVEGQPGVYMDKAGRFELPQSVSREHVRIVNGPDGVRIEELGSTFGTKVTAEAAPPPAPAETAAFVSSEEPRIKAKLAEFKKLPGGNGMPAGLYRMAGMGADGRPRLEVNEALLDRILRANGVARSREMGSGEAAEGRSSAQDLATQKANKAYVIEKFLDRLVREDPVASQELDHLLKIPEGKAARARIRFEDAPGEIERLTGGDTLAKAVYDPRTNEIIFHESLLEVPTTRLVATAGHEAVHSHQAEANTITSEQQAHEAEAILFEASKRRLEKYGLGTELGPDAGEAAARRERHLDEVVRLAANGELDDAVARNYDGIARDDRGAGAEQRGRDDVASARDALNREAYRLDPEKSWNAAKFEELKKAEKENHALYEKRQQINSEIIKNYRETNAAKDVARKAGGDPDSDTKVQELRAKGEEIKQRQLGLQQDLQESARKVARLRREAGVELVAASASEKYRGDPEGYHKAAEAELSNQGNMAVVGDIHLSPGAKSEQRFEALLEFLKTHRDSIQSVVITGDVVDANPNPALPTLEARFEYSQNAIKRVADAMGWDQATARERIMTVMGNHDLVRINDPSKIGQPGGIPRENVVYPPDAAGKGSKGGTTLYYKDAQQALFEKWSEWSNVVTKHPLESAEVPVPGRADGATMSVGHDVPLTGGARSKNASRIYASDDMLPDTAENVAAAYSSTGKNIGRISADRHTPIDIRGPKQDGAGGFVGDESVFYVSAGTFGEGKAADMPGTIMLANMSPKGDGRFYQWDVGDPRALKPVLVEHPAYELPEMRGSPQAPPGVRGSAFPAAAPLAGLAARADALVSQLESRAADLFAMGREPRTSAAAELRGGPALAAFDASVSEEDIQKELSEHWTYVSDNGKKFYSPESVLEGQEAAIQAYSEGSARQAVEQAERDGRVAPAGHQGVQEEKDCVLHAYANASNGVFTLEDTERAALLAGYDGQEGMNAEQLGKMAVILKRVAKARDVQVENQIIPIEKYFENPKAGLAGLRMAQRDPATGRIIEGFHAVVVRGQVWADGKVFIVVTDSNFHEPLLYTPEAFSEAMVTPGVLTVEAQPHPSAPPKTMMGSLVARARELLHIGAAPEPVHLSPAQEQHRGEFENLDLIKPRKIAKLPGGIPEHFRPGFEEIRRLGGSRMDYYDDLQKLEAEVIERARSRGMSLNGAREGILREWEARHGFLPTEPLENRFYGPSEFLGKLKEGALFYDTTFKDTVNGANRGGAGHGGQTHRLQWHVIMREMEAHPERFGGITKASELYKELGNLDGSALDWSGQTLEKSDPRDLWYHLFDSQEANWSSPETLRGLHEQWPGLGDWD